MASNYEVEVFIEEQATAIVSSPVTEVHTVAPKSVDVVEIAAVVGPPGPQGFGYFYRGDYTANTAYEQNDVVTFNGSTYLVVNEHTTGAVLSENVGITLWAPKGEKGTLSVGTVSTGAAGSSAFVTNVGTPQDGVLDFTIPRGDKGNTGTLSVGAVATGAAGTSVAITNTGTPEAGVLNFTIPRGDKGFTGTLSLGTVTTGAAGTSASITNSGTPEAGVFNFTIPRGNQGIQGVKGDTGNAATIAVGTVTTGAVGSNVTVTNSGTSGAAIFNFSMPRGAGVQVGGTTGQILAKNSATDFDTSWVNAPVPTNMVTLDTTQTVSGAKTFTSVLTSTALNVTTNQAVGQRLALGTSRLQVYYPHIVSEAFPTNTTGAILITTGIPRNSSRMSMLHVKGYRYTNGKIIDFKVAFYPYGDGAVAPDGLPGTLNNVTLVDNGNDGLNKYIGINGSTVAIVIGDANTTGYFDRLYVDAWITQGARNTNYEDGWSIVHGVVAANFGLAYAPMNLSSATAVPFNTVSLAGNQTLSGTKTFTAPTNTSTPLISKSLASQTGNLQEWQSDTAVVLSRVSASGSHAAGANASVEASFTARASGTAKWFQGETGGGAKFYIEAQQAGTSFMRIATAGTALVFQPENGGANHTRFTTYYNGGTPVTVDALPSQTGDLTQWRNSAGTVLTSIGPTGALRSAAAEFTSSVLSNIVGAYSGPELALQVSGATQMKVRSDQIAFLQPIRSNGQNPALVPLTVKGEASHTADLQQWQTGNGLAGLAVAPLNAGADVMLRAKGSGDGLVTWSLTDQGLFTLGKPTIGLRIRAAASQTADIQQWQDSTGAVVSRVSETGQIFEGANRVYSAGNPQPLAGYATETFVDARVNEIVGAAPGTLDTLNELAAALGNDPNFATTTANNIATKVTLTGNETIAGIKTFSSTPVVPDLSFAVSKMSATGTRSATTFLRGDNTWAAAPVVSVNGRTAAVIGLAEANAVVNLTTAQTIAGVKTFSAIPVVPDLSFNVSKMSATGTRSATTFLRGDNTWAAVDISNMMTTDSNQTIAGTKTFTPGIVVGSTTVGATNNIDFANPGVGGTQQFRFLRATDTAGMRVTEAGSDLITYQFYMSDNPDGGDFFSWYISDYVGAGSHWEPLRIGALETYHRAKTHYFYGNINQSAGPWYSGDSGTPWTVHKTGSGTLTLAPSVGTFTGTTRTYWVRIDGVGTPNTFSWGVGPSNSTAIATAVPITGANQLLDNEVYISFNATTGGDLTDFYQFRVSQGGTLNTGRVNATTLWEGSDRVYSPANPPPIPDISNMMTTDTAQSVTARKDFRGTTGLAYSTAGLELFVQGTAVTPRISFHMGGAVASQIGMDSAGHIRTFNNPGTGYEVFRAAAIYSNDVLVTPRVPIPFFIGGTIPVGLAKPKFIAPAAMTLRFAMGHIEAGTTLTYNVYVNGANVSGAAASATTTVGTYDFADVNINSGDRVQIYVVSADATARDLSVTVEGVFR